MQNFADILFVADVTILMMLIIGAAWSVAVPERRIWPPPGKKSWQYRLSWTAFYFVFGLNIILLIIDWNSWMFGGELRFIIGVPIALIGALLVSWGIAVLGIRNTSGLKGGFVSSGPYKFTRNPQYLGDMILFVGLSLIANSRYLWIAHILIIIVFAITSLAEESWLEEKYGEKYIEYKRDTSRFL